jgi:hypothetical protein
MTEDISIKVTVTVNKEGDWVAKNSMYSFEGVGLTPIKALEIFVKKVQRFYSGEKFIAHGGHPLDVSYAITQMQATISVGVREDVSLDVFGVDCEEEEEDDESN